MGTILLLQHIYQTADSKGNSTLISRVEILETDGIDNTICIMERDVEIFLLKDHRTY
jgi:hypothetical protein